MTTTYPHRDTGECWCAKCIVRRIVRCDPDETMDGVLESLLAAREAELRIAAAGSEAVLSMAVSRLGGQVEGFPTQRINLLQRIDELVAIERERDTLREQLAAALEECKRVSVDNIDLNAIWRTTDRAVAHLDNLLAEVQQQLTAAQRDRRELRERIYWAGFGNGRRNNDGEWSHDRMTADLDALDAEEKC